MSTSPRQRFSDPLPVVCGVCRRESFGLGHSMMGMGAGKVMWICDHPDCIPAGRTVYNMSGKDFRGHEAIARKVAGEKAGAYLDEIGKTDLASLTIEEYFAFVEHVITGFEEEMRRRILQLEAPF
jgi:hypothetical protein